MDDLDFEDWWSGSSYVDSGIPISIPDISVRDLNIGSLGGIDFSNLGGGFDLSDMGSGSSFYDFGYGDLDLGEALSFGDLSGIAGLGNVDLSGLANYDQGDFYDFGYGEAPLDPREIDGLQGSRTEETVFNEPPFSTDNSGDVENQPGGFYGNIPGVAEYDPRTDSTILYNPDGSIRETIIHGERDYDVEDQPGGFYGTTPTAGYDPRTNTTTVRNPDGSTRVINHETGATTTYPPGTQPPRPEPPPRPPTPPPPPQPPNPPISRDNALLMALLGGLLGLLGRGSAPRLPVGYQGGIPKYTAARVPGRGVEYTRAAGGGLMDLAGGGETARYLRGGTDGMADKIKTSIDGKQPARLSHGEFVIPADVVSHLGNGNSDAGADVLYDMMAKVRKARTGTSKQGKQINPRKMIPA